MEKYNKLRLNLQHFAEPKEPEPKEPEPKEPEPKEPEPKEPEPKEPSFTQEQVDQIVKDRIARAEKDKQDAVEEAKKLAKMSADQKREYEFEKLQEENGKLKAAQNKYELGKEASRILTESGIEASDEILDFVVKEDAETTNSAVKAFSELVENISETKMKEKLKGKSPKKGNQNNTGDVNPFSKEHFNLTEQGRLLKTDPELYKQLKAQAK